MSFSLTDDHRALAEVVDGFARDRKITGAARARSDAQSSSLPAHWSEMTTLGWAGLHIPTEWGGQGFGLAEAAVVLERLGASLDPSPLLPTVWTSALIAECGSDAQRERWLPALAGGHLLGATGIGGELFETDGHISGCAGIVLGACDANLLALEIDDDIVIVAHTRPEVSIDRVRDLDSTRSSGRVRIDRLPVAASDVLVGAGRAAQRIGWMLASAEAAGGARACLEMAVSYSKQRRQFGRQIGGFQAVKHLAANLLADVELATAAAWDASRAAESEEEALLTAAVARSVALPAFVRSSERNIQIHGGIGYTWEHDAHLFLRRAVALSALFGAEASVAQSVADLSAIGVRRVLSIELPDEAQTLRQEVASFVDRYRLLPPEKRRQELVDSGYFVSHWPPPWGRGAGAVEQLVIDSEFEGIVPSTDMGITGWVALTLVQHASPDQAERWIRPTLLGELRWCQMFSEPDAGSDAAAIRTSGSRVDGGWLVSGQKVWTSDAAESDWGFATVRTDPTGDKHSGITMMAIDMRSPGVDVRPLREMTGGALFNEVFLDEVFVSDDDVVGIVGQGWNIARATLGNERVTIGSRRNDDRSALRLLQLAERMGRHRDGDIRRRIGFLIAEEQARRILGLRQAVRAVVGAGPGPEGNVSKLLAGEHTQRTALLGIEIAGPAAVCGEEAELAEMYLFSRCLTIAGGTSEIVRNQIAERILGLPREPIPQEER